MEDGTIVNIADLFTKQEDGTWVLKTEIAGADSTGGAVNTNGVSQEYVAPTSIEHRNATTIQTHSGVTIAPNTINSGSWVDSYVNGSFLSYLGVTVSMTSGTGMVVSVQFSHDGVNYFSEEQLIDTASSIYGTKEDIKLPARYFKIAIKNKDAATPKTTNAYVMLKA